MAAGRERKVQGREQFSTNYWDPCRYCLKAKSNEPVPIVAVQGIKEHVMC